MACCNFSFTWNLYLSSVILFCFHFLLWQKQRPLLLWCNNSGTKPPGPHTNKLKKLRVPKFPIDFQENVAANLYMPVLRMESHERRPTVPNWGCSPSLPPSLPSLSISPFTLSPSPPSLSSSPLLQFSQWFSSKPSLSPCPFPEYLSILYLYLTFMTCHKICLLSNLNTEGVAIFHTRSLGALRAPTSN